MARVTAPSFAKTFAPLPLLNNLFMKWACRILFSLQTSNSPGPEALGSNFCFQVPLKYSALTRMAVAAAAVPSSTMSVIFFLVFEATQSLIALAPSLRLLASAPRGSRRDR